MDRIVDELLRLGPLEPGEELALVFDDAVVIASVSEASGLNLKVLIGYYRIEGDAFPEEAKA